MKRIVVILSLLASLTVCYEINQGVLKLNEVTHDQAIYEFPMIMISYCQEYTNDCTTMEVLMIEVAKVMNELGYDIKLATMDLSYNDKVKEEQNVKKFPTVKLFQKARDTFYYGRLRVGPIVNFIRKAVNGTGVFQMTTVGEINHFMKINRIALLSTMKEDDSDYKVFAELASKNSQHYSYLQCNTLECKNKYASKITLLREFDDMPIPFTYTELTKEAIDLLMEEHSVEPGAVLMDYTLEILYKNKTAILLFNKEDKELNALYKKVALEYSSKYYFITINPDYDNINKKAAKFFIVEEKNFPMVQLLKVNGETEDIYIMKKKEVTEANIKQFIEDYENNRLVPELDSEENLISYDGLTRLVGRTFEEEVFSGNKTYFVLFRRENCDHECKTYGTIWNDLALKYAQSETIAFAAINMDKNELRGISYEPYPKAVLYLKDDLKNPIVYTGRLDHLEVEDWMAWKLGIANEPVIYEGDFSK